MGMTNFYSGGMRYSPCGRKRKTNAYKTKKRTPDSSSVYTPTQRELDAHQARLNAKERSAATPTLNPKSTSAIKTLNKVLLRGLVYSETSRISLHIMEKEALLSFTPFRWAIFSRPFFWERSQAKL